MCENFVVDHDSNDNAFRVEGARQWDLLRDETVLSATVRLIEQVMQRRAWMVVGVAVVDAHVFEVWTNVLVEETLHFAVVEVRVNEDGAYVRFDHIGKALRRVRDGGPVVCHIWAGGLLCLS